MKHGTRKGFGHQHYRGWMGAGGKPMEMMRVLIAIHAVSRLDAIPR